MLRCVAGRLFCFGLVLSYDGSCSESDSEGEEAEGDRRNSYAPWRVIEEEAGYGD